MRSERLLLLLAALALAGAARAEPATEVRAPGDGAWLPLAVGNRWVYHVHEDRQFSRPDADLVRQTYLGRTAEEVLGRDPARPGEPAWFHVQRTTLLRSIDGGPPSRERSRRTLASGPAGLLLRAVEAPDLPPPDGAPVVFPQPLRFVSFESGTWKIGTLRRGDLRIALTGRVVGREDLVVRDTPYPAALVIAHAGDVSGTLPAEIGQRMRVRAGRYAATLWLARGVGIVKEHTEISFQATLADDTPVEGSMETSLELMQHQFR